MEKKTTLIKKLESKSKSLRNVQRSLYGLFDEVNLTGIDADGITTLILEIDEGQNHISKIINEIQGNGKTKNS